METSNRDRVRTALDLLREGLAPYIDREMRRADGAGWAQQRGASLPMTAGRHTDASIDGQSLDTSALLGLVADRWNDVFASKLGPSEKNLVHELRRWRNKWAHEASFTADDTYRALDDASRLLSAVSASTQVHQLEGEKQELLRIRYEEQTRRESREAATAPPSPSLSMPVRRASAIELKITSNSPNQPPNRTNGRPPTAADRFGPDGKLLAKLWHCEVIGPFLLGETTTPRRGAWRVRDTRNDSDQVSSAFRSRDRNRDRDWARRIAHDRVQQDRLSAEQVNEFDEAASVRIAIDRTAR